MPRGSTAVLTGLTDEAFFIECRHKLRAKNGTQALKIVSVDEMRLERQNDDGEWTTVLDTEAFSISILDDGSFEDALIRGVRVTDALDQYGGEHFDQNGGFITPDAYAQAFRLTGGGVLTGVEFWLKSGGSPVGSLYAKLYAASGTFGSGALPTGSALAVSEAVDVTSLPSSYAMVPFVFATPPGLDDDTVYCIAVEFDGTADGNNPLAGLDVFSSTHAGNLSQRSRSTGLWSAQASQDVLFRLIGFRAPAPSDRYQFVAECTLENLVTGAQTEDVFRAAARVVPSAENPIVSGVS